MNIFDPMALAATVAQMKKPAAFLLNKWFVHEVRSETDIIVFDIELAGAKRRLSPYVHPMVAGQIVESAGFRTEMLSPGYIKDKRPHNPLRAFARAMGERIGGDEKINPMERQRRALDADLSDQLTMLTRTLEVQAVEVAKFGTVTMKMRMPDGNTKTVAVDFGRDSSLQVTKSAGTKWTDSGVDPMRDETDMALAVLDKSGGHIDTFVYDKDAWRAYYNSIAVKSDLSLWKVKSGQLDISSVPNNVMYMGNHNGFDHYVYTDWYYDEAAKAQVPMLDSGRVIGLSSELLGVRHFGAIKDETAEFKPIPFYPKSWLENDPPVRYLMMQSAPLVAPYRPDASCSLKVL
jgi:hypothetical protein